MRDSLRCGRCFALLTLFVVGCGDNVAALYPVTGTLTKGGQPLGGVLVTFTPEGEGEKVAGVSSTGLTNDSGKFVLVSQTGKAGAVVGKHKVVLSVPGKAAAGGGNWRDPAFLEKMQKDRAESTRGSASSSAPVAQPAKSDLVPAEYADGSKSPLSFEVKAGDNNFDIPIP